MYGCRLFLQYEKSVLSETSGGAVRQAGGGGAWGGGWVGAWLRGWNFDAFSSSKHVYA
jgi:hypothetical protein